MNWGFGSRVPAEGHCAILDLGRMAAILDQDERLAFITVQPGVTFAQVDAFLRSAGSILFLPAIGGPPDASVIGNALERGHGIGPVPQRAAAIGAVEAVLADGRRASAGFPPGAAFRGAETHRHGIGPSLAGLFLQSNLAVVTSMTLALEPRPARLTLFHGRIGDLDALGRLLGALQPLILARALGPALCTVWNRYKRLACSGRYPWQAMDGITPLDLGRIGLAEDWEISGALYAPSAGHEAAAREALSSIGDRLQSLAYVDEDHDSFAAASPGFLGVPSPRNLSSVYWRKRDGGEAGAAPERDRCGVIQFAPLLPFGEGSTAALGLIERIVRDAGFEPQIGFDCADPRTIEAYVTIAYDRDAAGEDARALACHDALMRSLGEMGCPPYRLGVQPGGGGHIPAGSEALLALIKPALDPRCILAPGRYGIGTSGPR
jgi:4-cresol dehydrogenase (hydroxylating)